MSQPLEKPEYMTEETWNMVSNVTSSLRNIRERGQKQVRLYKLTFGLLGGSSRGQPLVLLTTTGRKTGKKITTPVLYVKDGDNVIVVASLAGYERHPGWWLNLEKDPHASVQMGPRKWKVVARKAEGEEREQLWSRLIKINPLWVDFQSRTQRQFPIVVLSPDRS